MNKKQTFEINWFAAAGSALGAVSSAVLLSTLGAAGTLIGAALGSLTISVGGSIYTQSLQKTKAHVDTYRGAAKTPGDPLPAPAPTAVLTPEPPKKSVGEIMRGLPWKRITAIAVGLFVAAMAIILAFELSTGRPVSSFTGGSSETRTGTTFNRARPASNVSPNANASDPAASASPSATPSAGAEPTAAPSQEQQPMKGESTTDPAPTDEPSEQAPVDPPAGEEAPAVVEPPAEAPAAGVVAPVDPPVEVAPPA